MGPRTRCGAEPQAGLGRGQAGGWGGPLSSGASAPAHGPSGGTFWVWLRGDVGFGLSDHLGFCPTPRGYSSLGWQHPWRRVARARGLLLVLVSERSSHLGHAEVGVLACLLQAPWCFPAPRRSFLWVLGGGVSRGLFLRHRTLLGQTAGCDCIMPTQYFPKTGKPVSWWEKFPAAEGPEPGPRSVDPCTLHPGHRRHDRFQANRLALRAMVLQSPHSGIH